MKILKYNFETQLYDQVKASITTKDLFKNVSLYIPDVIIAQYKEECDMVYDLAKSVNANYILINPILSKDNINKLIEYGGDVILFTEQYNNTLDDYFTVLTNKSELSEYIKIKYPTKRRTN